MKYSSKFVFITSCFFIVFLMIPTQGFGLVLLNRPGSFDGYTLFTPEFSTNVFLIDNMGTIVHRWNTDHLQGLPVYLLENGNIIRADTKTFDKNFFFGGVTGHLDLYDWNGTLLWEFSYSDERHLLHNDIEPLPNGNFLLIAWEKINNSDALKVGCKPELIGNNDVWSDYIMEVKPIFPDKAEIVWEWHAWDHLIQDYKPTNEHFGIVSDHPELIDINYEGHRDPAPNNAIDLFHINSIDYIEEFDQILLNPRNINEIWIIDHTTTTVEAAGHTGGLYGKGGDLLYRWGNPQAYNRGDQNDQQLFMQHDARWISSTDQQYHSITIFNNQFPGSLRNYSTVIEIIPPVQTDGRYPLSPDETYGPDAPIWYYTPIFKPLMNSPFISGAQKLPNGNMLICSGDDGTFLEVTRDKQLVWLYFNIYPLPFFNNVFKIQTYSKDYPGLKYIK